MAIKRQKSSGNSSRKIPAYLVHRASAQQRAELKAHGYKTTSKGVAMDGPRDKHRERIPGAKMEIQKGGTVKWSVGQRREYVVGFTAQDKKEFAKDRKAFVALKLAELIASHPQTFKKIRRAPQVRLQWGAYGATKDFSPRMQSTTTNFNWDKKRPTKVARDTRDRLVGLRIIVHIPKKRKRK